MGIVYFISAFFLVSQPSLNSRSVEAAVKEVYVPTGFDDNDVPEFIVEGVFENDCFSLKNTWLSKLDEKRKRFTFFVEANELLDPDCSEKMKEKKNVPYFVSVKLPILKAGTYELWNKQRKDAPVALVDIAAVDPNAPRDAVPYASVSKISVDPDALSADRYVLTLAGKFHNLCDEIDIEKTKIEKKTERIIEVLPVIKKYKDDDCRQEDVDFVRTLSINKKLPSNRYLFHVRIPEGSKNWIFDFKDGKVEEVGTTDLLGH